MTVRILPLSLVFLTDACGLECGIYYLRAMAINEVEAECTVEKPLAVQSYS